MNAKTTTLSEVGEMLQHVVKHMSTLATKEDVQKIEIRLTSVEMRLISIESELRLIRRDLESLRDKVENVEGYRKEIDHALERIAAIEKHIELGRKVSA